MVPASCCFKDIQCVINNQTVVESVWPDDCYHKASLQELCRQTFQLFILFQGVEFLQEHSAVMGSVTLAAAVTMVRDIYRGLEEGGIMSGLQTMGSQIPCMDNTRDEISQF